MKVAKIENIEAQYIYGDLLAVAYRKVIIIQPAGYGSIGALGELRRIIFNEK